MARHDFQYTREETEDAWLRRTLQQVHLDLDLSRHVTKAGSDPVQVFLDEQYRSARNPIFHAKTAKRPTIPGSLQAREKLGLALVWLHALVNDAMKKHCSSQRQIHKVDPRPYEASIRALMAASTLSLLENDICDDAGPAAISGSTRCDLCTMFLDSSRSSEGEPVVFGNVEAYPLGTTTYSCLALHKSRFLITKDPMEQLALGGVDVFEARMVFGLSTAGDARTRFAL